VSENVGVEQGANAVSIAGLRKRTSQKIFQVPFHAVVSAAIENQARFFPQQFEFSLGEGVGVRGVAQNLPVIERRLGFETRTTSQTRTTPLGFATRFISRSAAAGSRKMMKREARDDAIESGFANGRSVEEPSCQVRL